MAMARQLYPHDFLDDAYYAAVIDGVIGEADDERLDFLARGVKALDAALDAVFLDLPEERKVEALKQIEGSPFFEDVRKATVRRLYSNPALWPHFGYEGPSAHLGGYVERGFDDADWIPGE